MVLDLTIGRNGHLVTTTINLLSSSFQYGLKMPIHLMIMLIIYTSVTILLTLLFPILVIKCEYKVDDRVGDTEFIIKL